MSLKSLVREMRDAIGSISWRSFEGKTLRGSASVRSQNDAGDEAGHRLMPPCSNGQSRWANLPPELLSDIIEKLDASETLWPSRRHIVACAAVCRSWRNITKEIVKTPDRCGRLTFPISLKQPGPRESTIQCFIRRERNSSTYYLYLGLSPSCPVAALLGENGKLLLAARKIRRPTSIEFVISLDANDFSRTSSSYVGKLRSNFLGTKFTVYEMERPHEGAVALRSRSMKLLNSKKVSPRLPLCSFNVATIAYELNVLGTKGPRRMHCTMNTIPVSAVQEGRWASAPTGCAPHESSSMPLASSKSNDPTENLSSTSLSLPPIFGVGWEDPLVLRNKSPRWHEQLQCWYLNFRGRVTVASVKNFQLVVAVDPSREVSVQDHDKVTLQFGKIGRDIFTMDYQYPLSAFQAFAICLSSFDTKPACE